MGMAVCRSRCGVWQSMTMKRVRQVRSFFLIGIGRARLRRRRASGSGSGRALRSRSDYDRTKLDGAVPIGRSR
eukprot:scaffold3767_cov114-Isochrysis_galbana.AAC.3